MQLITASTTGSRFLMPLLKDLLDFSDHPLMPPHSAQLFAEHLPVEWIQHCLTRPAHETVRFAVVVYRGTWDPLGIRKFPHAKRIELNKCLHPGKLTH
ncbi:hypothetical protein EC970259_A0130 [Escherichia coli 99.0741]|nr:hypothetical protein EC970259_A0130 [Escherichia coli 99.0741]